MSKSLWNGPAALALTYIACGLFIAFISFTLAYSKGYKSADHEHETNNAQRDTSDVVYSECLRTAADLDGALECINDTNATTREAQRAEQDLNAQREMAQWAEGILWATIFIGATSVGATILGVRYVFKTLIATQEIGHAQTRAWVSADLALTNQRVTDNDVAVWFTAVVTCKNHGPSPALNVTLYAEMALFAGNLENQMSIFCESKLDCNGGYMDALFPGVSRPYHNEVTLWRASIQGHLESGDFKAIFPVVYGCINYCLIGSDTIRQTRFAYHVSNVVEGKVYALMPTSERWLKRTMHVTPSGIVVAD